MTLPAEPLTVEIEGEPEVWALDEVPLEGSERRLVHTRDFAGWFQERWRETEAGWWSRKLRISKLPSRISTAVGLVVRLQLRPSGLFRHWVAFSSSDRRCLDRWPLPEATMRRTPSAASDDEVVRFECEPGEPPLALRGPLELWPCRRGDELHHYRDLAASPRVVHVEA